MSNTIRIGILLGLVLFASCKSEDAPNYQFMPNMYEPVGYETYGKVGFLPDNMEARQPVENTVARGWMPYTIANDLEGRELARALPSPLDSLQSEDNLVKGAQLYAIYCAVCHGPSGDGQGILVQREKILGVPSYADPVRDITVGSTYHVIYYGLNAMGSYANQLDHNERWQVSEYVMKLKQDLTQ